MSAFAAAPQLRPLVVLESSMFQSSVLIAVVQMFFEVSTMLGMSYEAGICTVAISMNGAL